MNQYVGLDVSLEETKIHVLDEAGGRVWRGKCASHPDELETICKHAPGAVRIGLETGPLTTWLWTELSKRRLPMVCLDARQAQRALDIIETGNDSWRFKSRAGDHTPTRARPVSATPTSSDGASANRPKRRTRLQATVYRESRARP